jgi:hypothetical protein
MIAHAVESLVRGEGIGGEELFAKLKQDARQLQNRRE